MRRLPGRQRLALVWVRRHVQRTNQLPTLVTRGAIASQSPLERANHRAIAMRRGAVGVYARIVLEPGVQARRQFRNAFQQQGAPVETQSAFWVIAAGAVDARIVVGAVTHSRNGAGPTDWKSSF